MTRSEAAHLLNVAEDADAATVQAAYRRGMARWHPDRHRDDPEAARMAGEMAVLLGQARDTLLARADAQDAPPPPPPPPPMAQCPLCGGLVPVPPPPVCPHCGQRVYASDEPTPEAAPRKPGPPIPWWAVVVALLMFFPVGAILAVADLVALAAGRKSPGAPKDAHGHAWTVPGWLPPVAGVAVGLAVMGWPVWVIIHHAVTAGALGLLSEDLAGAAWAWFALAKTEGRAVLGAQSAGRPTTALRDAVGGGKLCVAAPVLFFGGGWPALGWLAGRWAASAVAAARR